MNKNLTFTVHGLESMNGDVLASSFLDQLDALLKGLKAASTDVNGKKAHDYIVKDLKTGSAQVVLKEYEMKESLNLNSSIEGYESCIVSLSRSDFRSALKYQDAFPKIGKLTEGVGKKFSHSEIQFTSGKVVRIDEFLKAQYKTAEKIREKEDISIDRYIGTAYGSFDGIIKEVDLRGASMKLRLFLSAGNIEIECIADDNVNIDIIRTALNKRVWVEGDAIYSGDSGLPKRIEISKIDILGESTGLLKWRGSFEPFEIEDWGEIE